MFKSIKTFIMDNDKEFLDNYWKDYKRLIIDERDDSKIIALRNSIRDTVNFRGKLYFLGNGASASLCSHAATDFTKQAKLSHMLLTTII